ncbi:Transposable element Tc1 transposase [Folsomia candida]|uniref:Transposable element Tc1 transposase n=1 Tax=Folsomia candida TaxID=158441 RepID=A0A226EH80_FOLCA|nr:Transposable element Tc1 transposase [Folsomia candida]
MRGKELSLEQRGKIISLHQKGLRYIKISQKTKFKVPAIQRIIQKWKSTGSVANKRRTGRKRKTTPRIDRQILKKINSNRFLSAPKIVEEIQSQHGVSISNQTVRNRIKEQGYKGAVARKKPFISKRNQLKRLQWAKDHAAWTTDDWKRVLWTDESKFNMFGTDGVTTVWRKVGESLKPNCLRKTVKHGGGSIMVWGSMSTNGVGKLHFIDGIMNKDVYQSILQKNLLPSVRKLRIRGDYFFQQDNDPKHTAKSTKEWFAKNQIKVLPWAAQSPDLNPIEHLWAELERKIANRNPSNKEDLKRILAEAWEDIDPDFTKKLVDSMPRRIQAVIEAKGGPTRY